MDKPVFLLGSHKSGTSLLRSLLDGHPALFSFPTESHFFELTGFAVDYALRKRFPDTLDVSREIVIERMSTLLHRYNIEVEPYGDAPQFSSYDIVRFNSYIQDCSFATHRERYDSYMKSAYYSLYDEEFPATKEFVEKSVENAEFAHILRSFYPECRFIHIVRNPYANLVSLRRAKHKSKGKYPFMNKIIGSLANSYHHLHNNMKTLANYFVLRYEDLLEQPENSMRRVAEYLQIDFTEELLTPTSFGQPWVGNSSQNTDFSGISTAPLTSWQKHLTGYETTMVNRISGSTFETYDYDRIKSGNAYIRNPQEGLNTYIKNRCMLAFYK